MILFVLSFEVFPDLNRTFFQRGEGLFNMAIKAINKTYQRKISSTYKYYRQYHELVNLDGTFETDKEQHANDKKQVRAFDNYFNNYAELPKREQTSFDRQHKSIHGYS